MRDRRVSAAPRAAYAIEGATPSDTPLRERWSDIVNPRKKRRVARTRVRNKREECHHSLRRVLINKGGEKKRSPGSRGPGKGKTASAPRKSNVFVHAKKKRGTVFSLQKNPGGPEKGGRSAPQTRR